MSRHFYFRDLNKDGYVELSDWVQCAQNLAAIREWAFDSPSYQEIVSRHTAMWITFWQPADLNQDGRVSLEEYLHLAENQRKMGFTYEMKQITKLFEAIFDTVDLDGDGEISLAEYELFFSSVGPGQGNGQLTPLPVWISTPTLDCRGKPFCNTAPTSTSMMKPMSPATIFLAPMNKNVRREA
ncbi:MAG: EF-hand domain-containing protein [Chloroflexi bacterium]|nr:EF-hand domain-containing protein [Chloroflexota bacterium]